MALMSGICLFVHMGLLIGTKYEEQCGPPSMDNEAESETPMHGLEPKSHLRAMRHGQHGRQAPPAADPVPVMEDCLALYEAGHTEDGVFTIQPEGIDKPFDVYCDMMRGGWTVFQKRFDGSEQFYRSWKDYEKGFGDASGEYWLGLEKMHIMTRNNGSELRIDFAELHHREYFAEYSIFIVDGAEFEYNATFEGYTGSADDAMEYHNGMKFTTYDNDNDDDSNYNCAIYGLGGWWYNSCFAANLNGPNTYVDPLHSEVARRDYMESLFYWYDDVSGYYLHVISSEMKMRRREPMMYHIRRPVKGAKNN